MITVLLPAMECFDWPTAPASSASASSATQAVSTQSSLASTLCCLRSLQHRVLRSWSEAGLVHTLLQLICCDVALGAAAGESNHFVGFRSPASEETFHSTFTVPEARSAYASAEPVSGTKVVIGALECLNGLLSLVLRPTGAAPEYVSLARHLLC